MGWIGVLVVLVGLLVSVGLHELGHMLPAKRFGVLVPEYAIGMGPRLVSIRRGETLYSLRLLPIGGFVRLAGMSPSSEVGDADHLPPGQEHRAMCRLSTPRRLTVMLMGPLTNLLLCLVLLAVALMGVGVSVPSTTLSAVSTTVVSADGSEVASPAAAAGIRAGDRLVEWDGEPVTDWSGLLSLMDTTGEAPVWVRVEEPTGVRDVEVTPVRGADGRVRIGVAAGVETQRLGAADVARTSWHMFTGTLGLIGRLPAQVWDLAVSLASGAPRDPAGPVSVIGIGRAASEVTAGAADGGLGRAAVQLLLMLASLNMALFAFNLLPLPPLDGGHVALGLWDGARRWCARRRGLAVPEPMDPARLVPVTMAVVVALVVMTLVVMVADVVRPVTLG